MSEALVENIEFRLKAPKVQLGAFDEALSKLKAIREEVLAVNAALGGLSTNSAFKRTRQELVNLFQAIPGGKKTASVEEIAKAANIPNIADFNAYIDKWKANYKTKAASLFTTGGEFRTGRPSQMNEVAGLVQRWFGQAHREITAAGGNPISGIQALFGKGSPIPAGQSALAAGSIHITASGPVHINAPGVSGGGAGAGAGGAGGVGGGGGSGSGSGGGSANFGPGGKLLEETTTLTAKGAKRVSRKEFAQVGEEVQNFFKEVNGALEQTKQATRSSPLKKLRDKLSRQVNDLQRLLDDSLGKTLDPAQMATIYRKQAQDLRALVSGPAGKALQDMGLGGLADRLNTRATAYDKRAGVLDLRAGQAAQRATEEAEAERLRGQRYRLKLIKNVNKASEAEAAAEEAAQREATRHAEKRAKADQRAAERRARATEALNKLQAGEQLGSMSHAEAQRVIAGLKASGYDVRQTGQRSTLSRSGGRQSITYTGTREVGNEKFSTSVRLNFENGKAAGAEVAEFNRKLKDTRNEAGALGGDFVRNTIKVTAWSASVGALYKSLELVRFSMSGLIDAGAQMARLDQVFSGVGGSTRQLTDDVMRLAAANGRTRSEAQEAAIAYARMGVSRMQVNEGVRASLIAANIAEISAGEATEKLIGIMQSYDLQITDLRTVLAELNAVSNISRVKVNDLFEAFARMASVAKLSGLSAQEGMGLAAAAIEKGGQPGAVGNMMKTVMSRLTDSNLQKNLRQQFRIEVTAEGGSQLKGFSGLLGEIFARYHDLSEAQRQSMLYQVAGATQVNRLSAMLDAYVRAQVLAINAQLNLNSAEEENAKIKATLRSQLAGLSTEWERLVARQGMRGPSQALTGVAQTFRNVLAVLNTDGGSAVTTGLLGVLTAASAKVLLVGLRMKTAAGEAGYLATSSRRVAEAMGSLNNLTGSVLTGMARGGGFVGRAAQQMYVFSEAALRTGVTMRAAGTSGAFMFTALGHGIRTLGMAGAAIQSFLAPMLVIYAASKVFNMGMEAMGLSSEKAQERLAGFNATAQAAAQAANAYVQAANLFTTTGRALENMRNPDDRKKLINEALEAAVAGESDEDRRRKKLGDLRAEFEAMEQINDVAGRRARLEQLSQQARTAAFLERQKERDAERKALAATEAEVNRLKDKNAMGLPGRDSRNKTIDELTGQGRQRRAQITQSLLEEADQREKFLEANTEHQSAIDSQRMGLESLAEFYRSIPTDSRADGAKMELVALEAQMAALGKRKQLLEEDSQAQRAGDFERAARAKQLREQEKRARDEYNVMASEVSGTDGANEGELLALDRKRREIESLVAQQQANGGSQSTAEMSLQRQLELIDQQTRKLREQQAALRANLDILDAQDRMRFGQRQGRLDTIPGDVGATDVDRLLNKRQTIEQQLGQMDEAARASIHGRAKAIELENQLLENQWDLRRAMKEAEREINQIIIDRNKEFRNGLLGSGPGEMLRKLSALRMSQNGAMGMGQFLSLAPGMRGDLQQLQPGRFDPRVWDLRGAMNRGGQQPNDWDFFEGLKTIQKRIVELAKGFDVATLPGFANAAAAHQELALQAKAAAGALAQLPQIIAGLAQQAGAGFRDDAGDADLPMDGQMRGLQAGR